MSGADWPDRGTLDTYPTGGRVVAEHPAMVTIRTLVGSERIVGRLVGEQPPRIC